MQSASVGLLANAIALATPVNAAFSTATTGGTLAAATYFYRVSAINANGETPASTETSQVTTGTTSTVTVNWSAVPGATGYNIYGRTTGAQQLIATVGAVTTYTDTGAITPSGALPTANTTIAPGAGQWPGGKGFFAVKATFGGGSVALQFQLPDNITWATLTNGSFTADGGMVFELPPCLIRALATTATSVYANAARIPA